MLKSMRLEYIFEFFGQQLSYQLANPHRISIKEKADQNFVNELRFHMTRMFAISQLVGINAAAFAYFGVFRNFRWYIGLPMTIVTFTLARNFSLKASVQRLYYPLEPLYQGVRRHQSIPPENPTGASGIRDIQNYQVASELERVPITQRTELTKGDKRKILK